MTREPPLRALAFGACWHTELALPPFHPAACETQPPAPDAEHIMIRRVPALSARTLLQVRHGRHVTQAADGFRYADGCGTVLDVFDDGRDGRNGHIDAVLAPAQNGTLPAGFYGTVSGLMLALRGKVPLHGSAVEIDGEAVLLCGASGAGKSTAAAALIALGARLISDDLTILHLLAGVPHVYAGRRTMRLFRAVADSLSRHTDWTDEPFLAAGKVAVTPPCLSPLQPVRLRTVILLSAEPDWPGASHTLLEQLYRPVWMDLLPGRTLRHAILALAAGQLRVLHTEPVEARSERALLEQGRKLHRIIAAEGHVPYDAA